MTNLYMLKIETNDRIVLFSKNAKQEISPAQKTDVVRNINNEPIPRNGRAKLKIVVETQDYPDVSALEKSAVYKIHSIAKFVQPRGFPKPTAAVDGSIDESGEYTVFRPIITAILTNFTCKANNVGEQTWRLEFEET